MKRAGERSYCSSNRVSRKGNFKNYIKAIELYTTIVTIEYMEAKNNPKRIRVIDNSDEDLELLQTFKEEVTCEECGVKGAYTIDWDKNQVGLCLTHIVKYYKNYDVIEQ